MLNLVEWDPLGRRQVRYVEKGHHPGTQRSWILLIVNRCELGLNPASLMILVCLVDLKVPHCL